MCGDVIIARNFALMFEIRNRKSICQTIQHIRVGLRIDVSSEVDKLSLCTVHSDLSIVKSHFICLSDLNHVLNRFGVL